MNIFKVFAVFGSVQVVGNCAVFFFNSIDLIQFMFYLSKYLKITNSIVTIVNNTTNNNDDSNNKINIRIDHCHNLYYQ